MRLRDLLDQYHVHDAREIARLLPKSGPTIDVTVTSPPYWNIKDYGSKNQIGFGQAYERYLDDIEGVFGAVYDATKATGSLWIISDTIKQDGEMRLLPFDISERLRKCGWKLQDIIIWEKDRTLPWSHQGKLRNIFEYVTFFSKGKQFKYHVGGIRELASLKDYWVRFPERYSPEGKTPSRSWYIPIPRQGSWVEAGGNYLRHACPLPPVLIERILRLASDPGDTVLDPFAGSGAVLATAKAMGRRFVGTDLNARYQVLFQTKVLPRIVADFASNAHIDERERITKERFFSAIHDLRCLKYPKEFVRLYRKKFAELPCAGVLMIPSSDRTTLAMILLVPVAEKLPSHFVDRAREIMKTRPLSKYGITATVKVARTVREVSRAARAIGMGEVESLYVYDSGRFYWWAQAGPAAELETLLEAAPANKKRSKHPRIVSTLMMQIDNRNPQEFLQRSDGR